MQTHDKMDMHYRERLMQRTKLEAEIRNRVKDIEQLTNIRDSLAQVVAHARYQNPDDVDSLGIYRDKLDSLMTEIVYIGLRKK